MSNWFTANAAQTKPPTPIAITMHATAIIGEAAWAAANVNTAWIISPTTSDTVKNNITN